MEIAIFGGAFDPPHHGHINLVNAVRTAINPDKFLIIPTGNAPHKSTATPFEKRVKLAEYAFPNCEVCEIEGQSESVSYTIDTLAKIRDSYPNSSLNLVIGSDMLVDFHKWYKYEQILDLCKVTAVARDSFTYVEYAERYGIELLEIPIVEMSSSLIREKMSEKRYTHSLNVAIMCGELSKKHRLSPEKSEKAYIAGILHDIMKYGSDVFDAAEYSDFALTAVEIATPKLWHAIVGAKYVRDSLGIRDAEIIDAIRFHTVGRRGTPHEQIGQVEKIVYIADKVSSERKNADALRSLAFENLDAAVAEYDNEMKRWLEKCH